MVDIRNFVNININPQQKVAENGTRYKVIVYGLGDTEETLIGANSDYTVFYKDDGTDVRNLGQPYYNYAKIFFQNGGVELTFVKADSLKDILADESKKKYLDTIIFVKAKTSGKSFTYDDIKDDREYVGGLKGVYRKILIARTSTSDYAGYGNTDNDEGNNSNGNRFIAVKVSNIVGAEMTIAAYLSKMKVYDETSVNDYDFTEEYGLYTGTVVTENLDIYKNNNLLYTMNSNGNDNNQMYDRVPADDDINTNTTYYLLDTKEDVSDVIEGGVTDGQSLQGTPYNFEMVVGGRSLNIGGNVIGHPSGINPECYSLVEQFIIIVLTQTTTSAVFTALSAKLSGQKGMGSLRTALSAELNKYVNSGFLVTNRVWMQPTLIMPNEVDSSQEPETVITKNTPLAAGYYIHVFKLSTDRRKVYIVMILPTKKGIRYVQVEGRTI